MLTYEDVTGWFIKATANLGLITHPEYWINSRSLEREFACTCHTGSCEGAENRSTCTVSFSWSTLDTALSLEGPAGVCNFFHEEEDDCPHLHTHGDRKSTRLNSSHSQISYAVFCLKKKK